MYIQVRIYYLCAQLVDFPYTYWLHKQKLQNRWPQNLQLLKFSGYVVATYCANIY